MSEQQGNLRVISSLDGTTYNMRVVSRLDGIKTESVVNDVSLPRKHPIRLRYFHPKTSKIIENKSPSQDNSSLLPPQFPLVPRRRKGSSLTCPGTSHTVHTMASSTANRWLRPEVYPLFAAVSVAVGICGFQLVRNICINPEVRVNKENRAAGVLDNFAEGEKYSEHFLRKYVRNRAPEIMPSINNFFSDPK